MEKKFKNFLVKGNLKDKISYQFLPNELVHGEWWFRILSVTYSFNNETIQSNCAITCNLST